MHGHIGDRKEIPFLHFFFKDNTSFYLAMQVLHLTKHHDLHTSVHDWWLSPRIF